MEGSGRSSRLQRFWNARALPFGLLFLLTFVMHLLMNMYASDDVVLRNTAYGPFLTFMVNRYFDWSTRVLADASFLLLLKAPPMLWRILDSCVYTAFAIAVSYLTTGGRSRRADWLCVCFFLIYPFTDMVSAGWITTTCVYLWTCAAIAFAMVPFKRLSLRPAEKLPGRWIALGVLSAFYAGSQEQSCCSLLALLALFILYRLIKKQRVHPLLWAELCAGLVMLTLHLSSPALAIRDAEEAAVWFSDYHTLTFLNRLELGFSSTLYHFLMEPNLLYLCFAALLFARLIQKKAGPAQCLAGAVPLFMNLTLGFGVGLPALSQVFPAFAGVREAMTQYGTGPVFGDWDTFLPLLLLIAAAACQIIALRAAFSHAEQGWLWVYVLLVGVAARWALGFSPTVWASGNRTFVILNFAFAALSVSLGAEMENDGGNALLYALTVLSVPAALQLTETLLAVNRIAK